jgi:hypothetical protein
MLSDFIIYQINLEALEVYEEYITLIPEENREFKLIIKETS